MLISRLHRNQHPSNAKISTYQERGKKTVPVANSKSQYINSVIKQITKQNIKT